MSVIIDDLKSIAHAPTLALLLGAAFWGVVWYPYRILAAAGLDGFWSTLFTYGGALNNTNLHRASQNGSSGSLAERLAAERALLQWVFAQGTLQLGDVLIIGSVSGTGWRLVELALQAKARGLTVIALTAAICLLRYSQRRFLDKADTPDPSALHTG